MKTTQGIEIPDSLRELVDPKRCALIVYDMQVGIVRQIKDGTAITARVKQVLDAARSAHMRVFFTRHLSLPKRLMGRLSVPHGDGMAACRRPGKGAAVVPAG